jgi:hypothetical protein
MVSETDIVNVALRFLGADSISALTDSSKRAVVMNDLYEETRDDLLAGHNWSFATKRQKLARLSTTPTFEFDYAYTLPSDWLRTVSAHDNDGGYGTIEYREEEVDDTGVLCSDAEDVYLRYVYRCVNANRMHSGFRRALAAALARDAAGAIPNSNTKGEANERRAKDYLAKAKSADALGSSPERRPRGSWADSRHGRFGTANVWPANTA